jgi:hypothetical protein
MGMIDGGGGGGAYTARKINGNNDADKHGVVDFG